EVVDVDQFGQILELDEDDDDSEFSRGMVTEYFDQARKTFGQMDDALKAGDLGQLADLGHFLKGSSAALGVLKVQASCEKIQHWGRPQEPFPAIPRDEALRKITKRLKKVKEEFGEAEDWFNKHYDE
ncbi:histidine-phosphotransfer domain, HPT domain-containing protein, partial [Pluteus cervinus]